jgi:glucose/arabinose dehydrogenase
MPRYVATVLTALALATMANPRAAAQQTSANTVIGSVAVKLKLINTISGSSNANPLYGTHAPGDSRLFLIQQGTSSPNPDIQGKLLFVDPNVVGGAVGTLLDFSLALPNVLDISHFEKGLLGVAFHPGFNEPTNPGYKKFYTYSSEVRTAHPTFDYIHPELAPDPATRVNNVATLREWTANSTTPTGVVGASRKILAFADPQNQHNAGTIAFSPTDGYLYWGLGDGGGNSSNSPDFVGSINSATDGHTNSTGPGVPHGNGQDRTAPFGKMLRINPLPESAWDDPNATVSANGQYQIPNDNPFTMPSNINPETMLPYTDWNAAWLDEVFAYGLRNPYRFSFDSGAGPADPNRGKLYVNDAGYNDREEIDHVVAGGNYGWVIMEGTQPMTLEPGLSIPAYTAPVNAHTGLPDALINPIAEYNDSVGVATIGGFVYRGSAASDLAGKYIFGDFQSPLRNSNGLLMYLDTNQAKAPGDPFTINRLAISPAGAALPNAALLGLGEGPAGQIYAMFDNGQIYELVPLLAADFDNDGDADGADLTILRGAYSTNAAGDADGDGDTDGGDLLVWQQQLGGVASSTADANAVPEPATGLLLALTGITMGRRWSCISHRRSRP